jgi:valacyclovir hydrolase
MNSSAYQKRPLATGIDMAYLDCGEGPPVVVLHGFTGTGLTHFHDLIEALSASYRVIAPDLRGYGRSQPPLRDFAPYFYQRDADDVAALIGTLECGPAHLLGFSDGAESALLLAATRPDLVHSVIAWGVSGVISKAMVESVESWLTPDGWASTHPDWAAEIAAQHGPDQVEAMPQGWARAAQAIYAAGGNICMVEAANIQCPVLLVNGASEVNNTPQDVLALSARIPNARLRFIEDAGHAVHWDQPEKMAVLVCRFLQDQ